MCCTRNAELTLLCQDAPRRKRRKVEKVDESSEVEEVAPPVRLRFSPHSALTKKRGTAQPTRVSRSRKAAVRRAPLFIACADTAIGECESRTYGAASARR